jgi:hypothetical protein
MFLFTLRYKWSKDSVVFFRKKIRIMRIKEENM